MSRKEVFTCDGRDGKTTADPKGWITVSIIERTETDPRRGKPRTVHGDFCSVECLVESIKNEFHRVPETVTP